MDVRNEKLFGNKSNFRNFELSSKTKVSQKGRNFYFERRNNVQNGTKQQNVYMFDHLKNIDCFEGTT